MAATRNTKKNSKQKTGKTEKTMLDQLLAELDSKVDTEEGKAKSTLTKGQVLVKSMIEKAIEGDQRMLNNVLKLVGKIDYGEEEETPLDPDKRSRSDWESLFAFYGKYEVLIRGEIERLRTIDSHYWGFDWFEPRLETAPWYEELYLKK